MAYTQATAQATHLKLVLMELDGADGCWDSDRSFGYRTGILDLTRLSAARPDAPCAVATHPLNESMFPL